MNKQNKKLPVDRLKWLASRPEVKESLRKLQGILFLAKKHPDMYLVYTNGRGRIRIRKKGYAHYEFESLETSNYIDL